MRPRSWIMLVPLAFAACAEKPPPAPERAPPRVATSSHAPPPPRRSCGELYAATHPRASIDGAVASDAGSISDADEVVAARRPVWKKCYQSGLVEDASMQGCVIIEAVVAKDGSVKSANVAISDGLSPTVIHCLVSELERAMFEPRSSESTLAVPITFMQQARSR